MSRKYDPAWVIAVLQDLEDFCKENAMPITAESVSTTKQTAESEIVLEAKATHVLPPHQALA